MKVLTCSKWIIFILWNCFWQFNKLGKIQFIKVSKSSWFLLPWKNPNLLNSTIPPNTDKLSLANVFTLHLLCCCNISYEDFAWGPKFKRGVFLFEYNFMLLNTHVDMVYDYLTTCEKFESNPHKARFHLKKILILVLFNNLHVRYLHFSVRGIVIKATDAAE